MTATDTTTSTEPGERFVAFPLPDGTYFQIRHLPWDMIATIERDHATSWLLVIDAPQTNGGVLADLARAVAIAADLDPPELTTAADLIKISNGLVVVDGNTGRPVPPEAAST